MTEGSCHTIGHAGEAEVSCALALDPEAVRRDKKGWGEGFAILGYEFDVMWQAIHAFDQHCPICPRPQNGLEYGIIRACGLPWSI